MDTATGGDREWKHVSPNDIEFSGERKRVRCNELLGIAGGFRPVTCYCRVSRTRPKSTGLPFCTLSMCHAHESLPLS